jgi:hypothetical protein
MAINPSIPINFGQYGNTGTIDISKFSRTGSPYTNSDSFALMLAQNLNSNFDILFGNEESKNSSVFGNTNAFGASSANTSSYLGDFGINYLSDIGGQTSTTTGLSPALEMIARSNLIGKTVEAINPTTRKHFDGKVESVSVQGGILLINVDGIAVPPENLVQVKE